MESCARRDLSISQETKFRSILFGLVKSWQESFYFIKETVNGESLIRDRLRKRGYRWRKNVLCVAEKKKLAFIFCWMSICH